MTAEPTANRFRSAVLSGLAGRHDNLVVRSKKSRVDAGAEGLTAVPVSRSERRRGNQRDDDRHRLSGERATVRHDGRDHPVELINLSAGGAMVRGSMELMLWDHVRLVLGEDGELECAVRWLKGDDVGLEFAHETRIECDDDTRDTLLRAVILKSFPGAAIAPLCGPGANVPADDSEDQDKRRGATRHPLIWSGVVYHDYDVEPVRLRNISVSGAQVQSAHDLPEGATVYLDLGSAGKLESTVCWTRGGQSGLAFAEPFDIQKLASVTPAVAGEVAGDAALPAEAFGNQEPWAPGWRRSTIDEMARSLGG